MAKNKKRKEFIVDTPLSFGDLIQLHSDIAPVFNEKWTKGRENERYRKGKHWTEEQQAEMKSQGRLPYSFTLIANKINTISATQRNARTSFRVEASQDPSDEIKAEVANIAMKDFERRTAFRYLESECFDTGIGIQYGAIEIYTDYDDDYNKVVLARALDYSNVVWDVNANDYELMTALFKAKRVPVYRKDLRDEYGEIANNVASGEEFTSFTRQQLSYFIKENDQKNVDYDVITILTHYQVVDREQWCVFFDDILNLSGKAGDVIAGKYKSKKEAESALRAMSLPYLERGIMPKDGDIVMHKEKKLDKYVFSFVGILEYEETNLSPEDCPIVIYRAFHIYDDWWTLTDLLKDPQIFLDRTMAQIDYSLGTDVKNVYTMNANALADNETVGTAQKKLTKTGGIIFTKGNSQGSPINPIQSKGASNQYFELAQIMQSFVEDLAGGRSFSGLKDQGNESGVAIKAKQVNGQLIAELFIDNLTRWKVLVGRVVLTWIGKYETAARTIKVGGSSLSPEMQQLLGQHQIYSPSKTQPGAGYVKMNEEGNEQSYLKDAKFELLVTEGELTETDADAKIVQLMTYQKITQAPVPPEVILQFIKMDDSLKQKLIAAFKAQQEQQQKMLQTQMGMKQQELDTKKAGVLAQTLP